MKEFIKIKNLTARIVSESKDGRFKALKTDGIGSLFGQDEYAGREVIEADLEQGSLKIYIDGKANKTLTCSI